MTILILFGIFQLYFFVYNVGMSKKARFLTPVCAVLIFFYVVLSAEILPKEIQFEPEWTIDIDTAELSGNGGKTGDAAENSAVPFKLGQTLGYILPDGTLVNKVSFPYKAALSKDFYAPYGTDSEKIDFFSPDGKKGGTVFERGFPYFTEDKKCIFLPGGAAFAVLNDDGSKKWSYSGISPITAFSTSKGGVIAGFADGNVVVFNSDGDVMQQYKPGGSSYEVIYGAALSESGKFTATLSGQENQRFVVSERQSNEAGSSSSIIFYKTLENELNRQVVIKFTKDEKNVYYGSADGVGLVNLKTLKSAMIPIKGRILSIKESDDGEEIFILSKEKNSYTVSVVEGFGVLAGAFSFDASSACIASDGGSIFVGRDSKISKIKIERK